jgi:purine nucleosidase
MTTPRARVIIDNDFSGDPDDLFQLVHHLLSPSVDVRFVIGSHLSPGDPLDPSKQQAENAARIAREALDQIGLSGVVPVYEGSNFALGTSARPIDNPAVRAIIAEAMRDDTELPLYVALGAGLTELASALLIEPRIADRMTAVWIGGGEHDGLAAPPPNGNPVEYNLNIDIKAAQVVFNDSRVPIWQVPRDVYRQCLVSRAELELRVRPHGTIGANMVDAVDRVIEKAGRMGYLLGETYALGDSPLVLLTALQSAFEPDSSSSSHLTMPNPRLDDEGRYTANPDGRPLRVYTRVDTRLMFEDLFLKLEAFGRGVRFE